MPASVITTTITKAWGNAGAYHVIGSFAVAAGDYVAEGLTVSMVGTNLKATKPPTFMTINSRNGYVYDYVAGTTAANGKIKILASTTEASVAATPAGVTGDTITFYAMFPGMR